VGIIDSLLHAWHHAAAIADEDVFFGLMAEDCIYLGTDITEKWKRDELKSWSQKYFKRESAWAFKAYEREIYLSGNIAYFDEKLETWMGPCRGSGVLEKTADGWKLKHYHLAVAIPNEKIKGIIDLINQDGN
jgi:ketosteroid isomerase-like protein